MRKYMLFLIIGIISGISLFILNQNILFYSLIFSFVFFIISYFYKKSLTFIFIGIVLGICLSFFKFSSFKLIEKEERNLLITISDKKVSDQRFRYFVETFDKADNLKEESVFYSDNDYEIGTCFYTKAKVKIANKNTNPYLFNFRNYLLSKNIKSILEIEDKVSLKKSSDIKLKIKNKFYKYVHNIFEKNLSKNSAAFVISVLLGENLIEKDRINNLGLAHILAISGLHIDLLVGFILLIGNKIGINYKISRTFSISLCIVYGYLISFPFSVMRVILTNIIEFLGFLFKKPIDNLKSLYIAAIFILIFYPFAILNSGYILSFISSMSVYLIYPIIKKYYSKSKIEKQISFIGSIQLGVFPFLIYYYGNFNLLSLLANFVIVPLFEISMYLIFCLVIFYPILSKTLFIGFKILDFLVYQILEVTKCLANFKLLNFNFQKANILLAIFFFVFIVVLLNLKKNNMKTYKSFLALNMAILLFTSFSSILKKDVTFSMIDIGQGDCFLLNDDGDYYLFDVGGPKYHDYDSGESILVPILRAKGIKNIKGVFISHLDKDHVGNLDILSKNFRIESILSTYLNKSYFKNYKFISLKKNDIVKLKNARIQVVFDGVDDGNSNNKSLGLLINIGKTKLLSLGDLESKYEDRLNFRADILKVSHHGSENSTSKEFLDKVKPKVSLISAGKNNIYGHPRKEVLSNLKDTKIYNTQDDGFVEIKFKDDFYKVEAYVKGGFFK